ncbi:MAG: chromate transporter [Eubacteriales bacterium]|nr:chromate transporter [Eubacteriales bacterium]
MSTLLQLFLSFLNIGVFSVGGGYAAIPLIQQQAVELHRWLTLTDFTDLITIAEMTPGPIAVNSATFVGIRMAGLSGAVIATVGCILPSCIIVSTLAYLYYKYKTLRLMQDTLRCLRPAVVALIASAGLSILMLVLFGEAQAALGAVRWAGAALFAAALFVLRKWKPNPIVIMLLCGGAGVLLHALGTGLM